MANQYNLPQSQSSLLVPNTTNPSLAVDFINSYIDKTSCEEFAVDISFMNIIDACYVSTMCSTKHYIKYPSGKINWFVSSELVKDFTKDMSLGNSSYFKC